MQWLDVGMQPAGHLSVVIFWDRTWKPQFRGSLENVNNKAWIISIFASLQIKVSNFLCSQTFMQNKKETNKLYKQKMENWEV